MENENGTPHFETAINRRTHKVDRRYIGQILNRIQ